MGLLTASTTADLMNPSSWTKSQTPIFVSNADTKQFGPGHNSFTVSEDGAADLLVYHDRPYRDITGDPLNDPNRRTMVQKLYWKADGTPDFGVPVPDGVTPVRLRSQAAKGMYLQYFTGASPSTASPSLAETQFRLVVPGLAGSGSVSIESTVKPGVFLRRSGGQVRFEARGSQAGFTGEASFTQVAGLADAGGVSFEVWGQKGSYLSLGSSATSGLGVVSGDGGQKGLATFFLE
jgi:hypothetical protein